MGYFYRDHVATSVWQRFEFRSIFAHLLGSCPIITELSNAVVIFSAEFVVKNATEVPNNGHRYGSTQLAITLTRVRTSGLLLAISIRSVAPKADARQNQYKFLCWLYSSCHHQFHICMQAQRITPMLGLNIHPCYRD
jgi:hypothetical protein